MNEMDSGGRIARRFAELRRQGRAGLITFITAGDPDAAIARAILQGMPAAGADLIEIGMPFSDPMADGPTIQAASRRALAAGTGLRDVLSLVAEFRKQDLQTPLILMGYYNPIYQYGADKFLTDAKQAGVDGLIIVDLPPEEDDELCLPARDAGLDFIRLATPTTDDERLPEVLRHASGFIYYVSIAGITGTRTADVQSVAAALARIRVRTDLPLVVGFGIKTPGQAASFAEQADAVVVASSLVQTIADHLDDKGAPRAGLVQAVLDQVRALSNAVRGVRKTITENVA